MPLLTYALLYPNHLFRSKQLESFTLADTNFIMTNGKLERIQLRERTIWRYWWQLRRIDRRRNSIVCRVVRKDESCKAFSEPQWWRNQPCASWGRNGAANATVNALYNDSSCNDIRLVTIRYPYKPDLLCKITIFSVFRYRKVNNRTHRQIVIFKFSPFELAYLKPLISPTTLNYNRKSYFSINLYTSSSS
jgi:hypothetical protein